MKGKGKATENKAQGNKKREREKRKMNLWLRKVSLLQSSRSRNQTWHRAWKGGNRPQCVVLEKQEFSLMGTRAPAVMASALVCFMQVSCQKSRIKLLFVSEINQLSEESGQK